MPPRYTKSLSLILTIFLVLFLAVVLPQAIKIQLFPSSLRLVPGQNLRLSLKQPFSIYLTADRPAFLLGRTVR